MNYFFSEDSFDSADKTMSARRTRSGTSTGSSKSRRPKNTMITKQDTSPQTEANLPQNSVDETTPTPRSSTKQAKETQSSGPATVVNQVNPNRAKDDLQRQVQPPRSNIWDHILRPSGEFLSTSSSKAASTPLTDGPGGKSMAFLTEKSAGISAAKTNRKPEILVSLLEGEIVYPTNHVKDGSGIGQSPGKNVGIKIDNPKKVKSADAVYAENRATAGAVLSPSTACFFRNCDCKQNDGLHAFPDMPNVPGEPFFVSLSNDENKELNMVKTSCGTVRVGSHQSQLGIIKSHGQREYSAKSSALLSCEKTSKIKNSNQESSDKCKSLKSHASSGSRKPKHDQKKEKVPGQENDRHIPFETSKFQAKNTSRKPNLPPESTKGESYSERRKPVSGASQEEKKSPKSTLKSEVEAKRREKSVSSHSKSQNVLGTSKYPLMKEILTQPTDVPSAAMVSPTEFMATNPERVYDEDKEQPLKSINLNVLNTTIPSVTKLAPTHSNTDKENTNAVKRSERIKCRNGSNTKSIEAIAHQSVISTMRVADQPPKAKSKPSITKTVSKSTPHKVSKAKNKSEHGETKKMKDSKGSKEKHGSKKVSVKEELVVATTVSEQSKEGSGIKLKITKPTIASVDKSADRQTPRKKTTSSSAAVMTETHCSSRNAIDHNYDISANSADPSRIGAHAKIVSSNGGSIIVPKTASSKKSGGSAKQASRSKAHRVRPAQPKAPHLSLVAVPEAQDVDCGPAKQEATPGQSYVTSVGSQRSSSTVKRCRKKTRKATEAFGDEDVFNEGNWAYKKSKGHKRSESISSDSSGSSSSHRRLGRPDELGTCGRPRDPVLEEHAFILWASENRSHIEQQQPGTNQVDAILMSRWCEVSDNVKAKFFLRAREAFSDDDRSRIRSSSMTDQLGDILSDSDPVFAEFLGLPTDRQRDMLRKWLKCFQKTLPKREYMEFIVSFKRACNRDVSCASGGVKRTRMRCLDPSHYKTLFDMIRATKPRVLEIYRSRRDRERVAVSDTYSVLLMKLVRHEEIRFAEPACQSQLLTDVLQDLGISSDWTEVISRSREPGSEPSVPAAVSPVSQSVDVETAATAGSDGTGGAAEADDAVEAAADARRWGSISPVFCPLEPIGEHNECDLGIEESDYSLLNSDLAADLLSALLEVRDLPVLDQDTLDQIFLAPPRTSISLTQPRRPAINLYGRCLEPIPASIVPLGSSNHSLAGPPPGLAHTDVSLVPRSSLQFSSGSTANSIVHHVPVRFTNAFSQKYANKKDVPSMRATWCQKISPVDMHTYSSTLENPGTASVGATPHFRGQPSKCIKVHAKVLSPQMKLNIQPLQMSVKGGRSSHQQQEKAHPHVIPVSCGPPQRYPTIIYSPTNPAVLDKVGCHLVSQVGTQTLMHPAPSSSPRLSPQPISLSTASPLITSLTPLPGVKYSHAGKSYGAHCQMVPYRPRLQLATTNNNSSSSTSNSHRRAHTIPISTSHRTNPSRNHNNLQQIKVCLSTQALKIPIAKLREPRKPTYVKGKVKSLNFPQGPLKAYRSLVCSQACQFTARTGPSPGVMAKVMNFQVLNEAEQMPSSAGLDCRTTNVVLNPRQINTTFIGTMRPVNVQPTQAGIKSTPQLQLVSMVGGPTGFSEVKSTELAPTSMGVDSDSLRRSFGRSLSPGVVADVLPASNLSCKSLTHGPFQDSVSSNEALYPYNMDPLFDSWSSQCSEDETLSGSSGVGNSPIKFHIVGTQAPSGSSVDRSRVDFVSNQCQEKIMTPPDYSMYVSDTSEVYSGMEFADMLQTENDYIDLTSETSVGETAVLASNRGGLMLNENVTLKSTLSDNLVTSSSSVVCQGKFSFPGSSSDSCGSSNIVYGGGTVLKPGKTPLSQAARHKISSSGDGIGVFRASHPSRDKQWQYSSFTCVPSIRFKMIEPNESVSLGPASSEETLFDTESEPGDSSVTLHETMHSEVKGDSSFLQMERQHEKAGCGQVFTTMTMSRAVRRSCSPAPAAKLAPSQSCHQGSEQDRFEHKYCIGSSGPPVSLSRGSDSLDLSSADASSLHILAETAATTHVSLSAWRQNVPTNQNPPAASQDCSLVESASSEMLASLSEKKVEQSMYLKPDIGSLDSSISRSPPFHL